MCALVATLPKSSTCFNSSHTRLLREISVGVAQPHIPQPWWLSQQGLLSMRTSWCESELPIVCLPTVLAKSPSGCVSMFF